MMMMILMLIDVEKKKKKCKWLKIMVFCCRLKKILKKTTKTKTKKIKEWWFWGYGVTLWESSSFILGFFPHQESVTRWRSLNYTGTIFQWSVEGSQVRLISNNSFKNLASHNMSFNPSKYIILMSSCYQLVIKLMLWSIGSNKKTQLLSKKTNPFHNK